MIHADYVEWLKNELVQGQETAFELKNAYDDLSKRYRSTNISGFSSKAEMVAYIQARFPATYSVVDYILKNEIYKKESIVSLLDLGAGPGTATFAALQHFNLKNVTLIEQTPELLNAAGEVFISNFPNTAFSLACDSVHKAEFPKTDLVILSYLLTEMSEKQALALYAKSLKSTVQCNLVVLPGTPAAFSLLLTLRDYAISMGASVLAPCSHMHNCPMLGQKNQWCHFKQRLNRSRTHQEIKKGSMGYEDEPYCYLLVMPGKTTNAVLKDRVVNTPTKRSAHIYVDTCAASGTFKTHCVTKKDKLVYKIAKNLTWGDLF